MSHASHKMRFSIDSSVYDEICELCGRTDVNLQLLSEPCPKSEPEIRTTLESALEDIRKWQNENAELGEELAAAQDEVRKLSIYIKGMKSFLFHRAAEKWDAETRADPGFGSVAFDAAVKPMRDEFSSWLRNQAKI